MAFTQFNTGSQERHSWVAETSHGSGGDMVNDGTYIGSDVVLTPQFRQNWQDILNAGDSSRAVSARVKGTKYLNFSLEFTPHDWSFMKYVMSNADAGSNPYTHTFTEASAIQSFKLEWVRYGGTDSVITLTGCVIKKVSIRFQKATGEGTDGFVRVVAECVAKDNSEGSSVTTLSDSVPTSASVLQYRHVKLTLEGNEIVEVNNGELTIDNSISEGDSTYCNSTTDNLISEPILREFRIGLRINVNQKDNTYYDMWDSEAALTSTNKLEFIKGANDDMIFTFENCYGGMVAPTILGDVINGDIVLKIDEFTSAVATDSIATY